MSILKWATHRKASSKRTPGIAGAARGWIGIDFGSHGLKLVQVERRGSEIRLAARWSLTHAAYDQAFGVETFSEAMPGQIANLKGLKQLFSGRKCAAVFPMALVEHRLFEIPRGSESEQHRMTGEELAAELAVEPQDLAFDCWDSSLDAEPDAAVARMLVNSVPKSLAQKLGDSLLAIGFECQVLDGVPCALARAVGLADPAAAEDAVVAIDLSYSLPVVVLVKRGRPLFARTLRGVGLQSIMQPLQAGLELSSEECQQLLVRYGVTAIGQQPTLATGRTMQIIARPLQDLLSEIKRTVDYISQNFRGNRPQRVCLFGGGAAIKNLPEHIGHKLELPTATWGLSGSNSDPGDAIYGVAAGLSALAWEDKACS